MFGKKRKAPDEYESEKGKSEKNPPKEVSSTAISCGRSIVVADIPKRRWRK